MRAPLLALLLAIVACATPHAEVTPPRDVGAAPATAPTDVAGLERDTLTRLRDGTETPELLLAAALVAGGVTDRAELDRYARIARDRYEALLPDVNRETDPFQRARVLLTAMHGALLRSYSFGQTAVQVALDTGVYNCVSSAVLYNVYAGWLGLSTGAAVQTGHAFSWVNVNGRRVEVETTTKTGFDPLLTPEEYRRFLAEHQLPADVRATTAFVPNKVLVSRTLANRLVILLGAAGSGLPANEQALRAALALLDRILLITPEERSARHDRPIYLQQLGILLVNKGSDEEGFQLLREAVQVAEPDVVAAARQNLRWGVEQRLKKLAGQVAWAGIDEVLTAARALNDCPSHAQECAGVDAIAMNSLWNEAIAQEHAGQQPRSWDLTAGLIDRFPAAVGTQNHVHFADLEAARRWQLDHDSGDGWLREQLARIGCASRGGDGCAVLATNATARWFQLDTTKALAWARLAFGWTPQVAVVRRNYRGAAVNEIIRFMNRRECDAVKPLGDELSRVGLLDEETAQLVGRCQSRSGT